MNTAIMQISGYNITVSVLLSVLLTIGLCIGCCYWLKSKMGRGFGILLIIASWWGSFSLDNTTTNSIDFGNMDAVPIFKIGYITIGATLFFSWVVMIILTVCSWLVTRKLKTTLQVSHTQTALEMTVMTIRSQIKDISGDNPARYMPIMGTFFLFIGLSNLLTIIPGFQAPTASLSTTMAFSLCVFFAMPIYGIKNAGVSGYLKKYIDPTPIMLPLNILSDFSSTFSLAFRLYGNMLSGVIIATVLVMLAPLLVPLPLQILGLITGMIQAYIFALLAIVYVTSVGPEKQFVDHLNYD